jgi:two-component system CheB/CheR fusion protein
MNDTNQDTDQQPIVIGIGASAGGLEALQSFFDHFDHPGDLCFVVIQHLSPDFKSLMDELLSRHTRMKIVRVEDEATIEPAAIYLIPPKKYLQIQKNRILATDMEWNHSPRLPVDHFFETLAEERGAAAIGVILSGTGSDGTRGAKLIKSNGGLVIAQAPETCKFDGMPKSIIRAGLADQVLAPEEMAAFVQNYINEIMQGGGEHGIETDEHSYGLLLSQLQLVSGIDFSSYRSSTIIRRIERRVKVLNFTSLQEYCDFITQDPTEIRRLHSDLLIGVTQFFRNNESFELLDQLAISEIVKRSEQNPIRVWVAGCSTGEEAYSIAIMLREAIIAQGKANDFKIFATDIDAQAIKIAGQGLYPESINLEMLHRGYFEKYFIRRENGYEVVPQIRNSIVFSVHNVFRDPPFSRIDLISCRNLLIYFKPTLQSKVISVFHFAAKPDGYLFLGKSETAGEINRQFRVVHPAAKIFQKINDSSPAERPELRLRTQDETAMAPYPDPSLAPRSMPRVNYQKDVRLAKVYENILSHFVECGILFDSAYTLLHVFGEASNYLQVPVGQRTHDVLKLMPRDLALAVRSAVDQISPQRRSVSFENVICHSADTTRSFDITLMDFTPELVSSSHIYLVKIMNSEPHAALDGDLQESFDERRYSQAQITNLEEQLDGLRESLQSTIEELETTNEELQSSNEELMSSNEELQSANEELQSVNEELYTVNAEYQSKIDELQQAHRDIEFLLKTSSIGMIFLDRDLKIRRYNSEILKLVNVMRHDVGRPITDITFIAEHDLIIRTLKEVMMTKATKVIQIANDQSKYIMRIVYCTEGYETARHAMDYGYVISAFNMDATPLQKGMDEDQQVFT